MSQARKMLLSSHTIQEGFVSTGNWRRRSFSEAMQSVFGLKRKAVMWFLFFVGGEVLVMMFLVVHFFRAW